MDTLVTIIEYGAIAAVVLALCIWVLGLLILTLPMAAGGLVLLFVLGLPVWAWMEYGWGATVVAVLALAAARGAWDALRAGIGESVRGGGA